MAKIRTPQRPTNQSGNGLSAQALSLRAENDRNYLGTVLGAYQFDKHQPWRWYNQLGEVHYALSRSAHIAGYARLSAVHLGPDGLPDSEITSGAPADVLAGLIDPYGGVRGLIERFYLQRKVAGDSYLIRSVDRGAFTGHMFISPSELDLNTADDNSLESVSWRSLPQTSGRQSDKLVHPIASPNFLGRVWKAHPQWRDLPDTPLMSCNTECELLHKSTQVLKAKMMNRLTMAGILYIASEIQAVANGDLKTTQPDKILDLLVQIMQQNYDEPDSGAAVTPILMRAPAEFVDAVKFITEDRDIYESDLKMRQELIERILFSFDVTKPSATGEANNRFSAWNASDDERRIAVQPDLDDACWAFNKLVLWPQLKKANFPANPDDRKNYAVWATLERADIRANRSEDVRQANDRVLISDTSARRDLGYGKPDAPDDDEQVRIVGRQMKSPFFATWGLPVHKELEAAGAWDYLTGVPGPAPDSAGGDPAAGPGDTGGGPDDSDPQTPADGDDPRSD